MTGDRPSGGVGTRLREARGRRGASLRQIADTTKIPVGVLEALERNDVSRLPGGIFSRAFVRSYAVEVGLDPDEMVEAFTRQFPTDTATSGSRRVWQEEDGEALDSERRMASTFLRLIAISLPIAAIVMYFGSSGRSTRSRTAVVSGPVPTETGASTVGAPASGRSAVTPLPAAPPAAVPAVEQAGAPDQLTVGLTATRACWVSAIVDGKKTIERLLQAGEQDRIDVRRDLVLTIGDAAALTLTLNGANARPLGQSGEVKTVRLNPGNFKDLLVAR